MIAICDHYEPLSPGASQSLETGDTRVKRWLDEWPQLAAQYKDSDGRHPRHSIFFPAEEPERPDRYIPMVKPLVAEGWAEVEVHLHHRNDTASNLDRTLREFRNFLFQEQGMLGSNNNGEAGYAFIHGNWALCNSRPDGDWCGVNEEIEVLLDTGCYVDYTFPSIPSPTQPKRFCNAIYWAKDIKGQPRSHEHGRLAKVGREPELRELLLIQGPAALNWKKRKGGIIPRIENADLCGTNPPSSLRADLWLKQHIHIPGQPNWVFIKLHTHGCLEGNMPALLEEPMKNTLDYLTQLAQKPDEVCLHFVSAREMYNIARAAIAGKSDSPNNWRDYIYKPPACMKNTA
ncbi:hypothetical protein [Rubellicoccus peritrichatus]|uniref:Uncharacterized protein n=1 Tax=Rubellicoccus peritrichatus TaxID=3080537 RepID=A0AAQ3L850_9BACT|nr:hypothetical protein [Puniceicoccus sp. CR14]WOO41414.1 hypothetical protein RZN69_22570 [Puniceicoccus sp. CR14]